MLGDLSASDQATLSAWIAQTQASGRVVTRMPNGVLAGAIGSRLATQDVADYPADNGWNYQVAPSNIVLLDQESSGGTLDISGGLAELAMDYSDTVNNTLTAVYQGVQGAAGSVLSGVFGAVPWWAWAGVAGVLYLALKNPERTKSYARRWMV